MLTLWVHWAQAWDNTFFYLLYFVWKRLFVLMSQSTKQKLDATCDIFVSHEQWTRCTNNVKLPKKYISGESSVVATSEYISTRETKCSRERDSEWEREGERRRNVQSAVNSTRYISIRMASVASYCRSQLFAPITVSYRRLITVEHFLWTLFTLPCSLSRSSVPTISFHASCHCAQIHRRHYLKLSSL